MKKHISHQIWNKLLKNFVADDGFVNYRGLKGKQSYLEEYLNLLSTNPPAKNWPQNEQLTYWINAYNAFTVKLILDNYGVKSIKDIKQDGFETPWQIPFFKIGGEDFTLDKIEHEIIRVKFDEARIHFSIVCASGSCPVLRNEAYEADKLESQLQDQTENFLKSNKHQILEEDELKLSPILKWYQKDFEKQFKDEDSLKAWLTSHGHQQEFNERTRVTYLPYNWELNGE